MVTDTIKILYATETGNSEDLAERTVEKAEDLGFEASSENVSEYDVAELGDEKCVIVIASTWGDGEPPDDAWDFNDTVVEGEPMDLSGISFCVLSLGDTEYEEFCAFGKAIDKSFEEQGGTRFMDRTDLNVDYEDEFEAWVEKLFGVLQLP